jgi:hypothetical protein
MRLIFYYARVIIEVLGVGLAREIHTFLRARVRKISIKKRLGKAYSIARFREPLL